MLQTASTYLFNPLVPKADNSVKIYYFLYKLSQWETFTHTLNPSN